MLSAKFIDIMLSYVKKATVFVCYFYLAKLLGCTDCYLTDWHMGSGRLTQPTCVDIPANLSLCHGIGYTKMRLPNLLDHDTMAEVSQQAVSWVPLFNLKCHPDTQLFLCSLFSPVCLDRPIYPCRSLCEAVRNGCAGRMSNYGYPWPDMVRCDKFPVDNDMCIPVQSHVNGDSPCSACSQPETYENIMDHYCRADFVIKTRIGRIKSSKLKCKKARIIKVKEGMSKKELRRPTFQHSNMSTCCNNLAGATGKKSRILLMGNKKGDGLVPSFIMEWKKTPDFRMAVKMMKKKVDCTNPKELSRTVIPEGNPRDINISVPAEGSPRSVRKSNPRSVRRRQEHRRRRRPTTTPLSTSTSSTWTTATSSSDSKSVSK